MFMHGPHFSTILDVYTNRYHQVACHKLKTMRARTNKHSRIFKEGSETPTAIERGQRESQWLAPFRGVNLREIQPILMISHLLTRSSVGSVSKVDTLNKAVTPAGERI